MLPPQAWAWGAICLALASACQRRTEDLTQDLTRALEPAPASAEANGPGGTSVDTPHVLQELTWHFDNGPFGPTEVLIGLPEPRDPSARFPVLVAFHGRGESLKGSRLGARGWMDDYQLPKAISRLQAPPLEPADFERYVSEGRLERLNAALHERGYGGLIVVCPFLPDVLHGDDGFAHAEPLASFIVDTLLPRVYAKTPALGTAASTGIDGVSLGGRAALLVGLSRPLAFGSIGTLQAALDASEVDRFAELAANAFVQNAKLTLRLVTSDEDYYLDVNQKLSAALDDRAVPHALTEVVGTHSYRFNRGPGGLEMLLFHDRVLRGWATP
ncbi:MAG TPA: alpha/beta hydrolase-fold protein [Polyangiaceae bacterium]|nr:alpha/beta hydrolase-fold protein [Polyangiaceae bacterium]